MSLGPDGKHRRGTSNTNTRGSVTDRRVRKQYLLDICGDGLACPCYRCGRTLTFQSLEVDRIIPGAVGGRYVRGNIRPSCGPCNRVTGEEVRTALRAGALGEVDGARVIVVEQVHVHVRIKA